MAIRFSLHHLPSLLAPPLRSSFSSFSTYFSLHTYRPPPCLHLLHSPSHTSLSPLQFGRVVCACWIRSLSKFGHAWQRRWAPAGWTGGLFSPPDPYIKLQQGLGIPVTPLRSSALLLLCLRVSFSLTFNLKFRLNPFLISRCDKFSFQMSKSGKRHWF